MANTVRFNQAACRSFTYHSVLGCAIQRERNVLTLIILNGLLILTTKSVI